MRVRWLGLGLWLGRLTLTRGAPAGSWRGVSALPEPWPHHLALIDTGMSRSMAHRAHSYEIARRSLVRKVFQAQKRAGQAGSGLNPPDWYGGFSESESTYDSDAFREQGEQLGSDLPSPSRIMPFDQDGLPAYWFEETKSGGPKQAWQTFYPALGDDAGRGLFDGTWKSSNGKWQQSYEHQPLDFTTNQAKPASWFDTIVDQTDAFGRKTLPDGISGRTYTEWATVAKSVNLTCQDPGCVANATALTMYDPASQRAHHCRLTVKVHATDFDDDFSEETVEWITANDVFVNSNCDPMAKGCDATSQAPLYSCITHYNIQDLVVRGNGTLNLAAKISPMVDECPKDGFLLNGVATATCYVAPLQTTVTTTTTTVAQEDLSTMASCPLQCDKKNCTATCVLPLNLTLLENRICNLEVKLNQTDFDGDLGSVEQVEWIKVDGTTVATNVTPGKNPCKSKASGAPLTAAEMIFTAVSGEDVTASAQDGKLIVEGKITNMVDECASNGKLLDAVATVNCTMSGSPTTAAPPGGATTPAPGATTAPPGAATTAGAGATTAQPTTAAPTTAAPAR